jgi:hypothetical protein
VTCRIAPYTSLDWRNYEFSGTIIKPAGNVFDSAGVGVIFYAQDQKNYYALKVKGRANDTSGNANKFTLISHINRNGSEYDSVMAPPINTPFDGSTDTMNFSIRVTTNNFQYTIKDSIIGIEAIVWPWNASRPPYPSPLNDGSNTRKVEGFPGMTFDYSKTSLLGNNITKGIKLKDLKIRKVGGQ